MAGKYPTLTELKAKLSRKIPASKDVWESETLAGLENYLTWYAGFASRIYPLVATLPEKTGDSDTNVDNRVKPVAREVKRIAEAYRRAKREERARKTAEEAKALIRAMPIPA